MFNFDISQFDQTNLLFILLAAAGLIRERSALPFIVLVLGNLIYGLIPAVLLSFLIIWHRVDRKAPSWVQYKDLFGAFLLLTAAVAPEPIQEFAVSLGVLVLSLSFGKGFLGVIPALLLLRQYQSHPVAIEIIFGSAGLYWVALEVIRWSKAKHQEVLICVFETICVFGILFGLKDSFLKWSEDSVLVGIAVGLATTILILAVGMRWKRGTFIRVYEKTVSNFSIALTLGTRLISREDTFVMERPTRSHAEIDGAFGAVLAITLTLLAILAVFFLMGRGGLN